MADPGRRADPGMVAPGRPQRLDRGDSIHTDQRSFGLTLMLLSALGAITGVAAMVLVNWRLGVAIYVATALILAAFLCWEIRRHTAGDGVRRKGKAPVKTATSETSPR